MTFVSSPHVSCSGMVQTTTVLGDCSDHYRARGLHRPLPCSGTVPTTTVLGDCSDHYHARGLFRRMLGDCSPRLHVTCTHIQSRGIYLDLATRLILLLPTSSGTTSVQCTCRCISYGLYYDWIFNFDGNSFLDPSTTCLRHLLSGSGTKWAHFTLR